MPFKGRFQLRGGNMFDLRCARKVILVAVCVVACGGPACAEPTEGSKATSGREAAVSEEFRTALVKVDAAQLELQRGRPAAFKALWSQAGDVRREPDGWRTTPPPQRSQVGHQADERA